MPVLVTFMAHINRSLICRNGAKLSILSYVLRGIGEMKNHSNGDYEAGEAATNCGALGVMWPVPKSC